MKGTKERAGKAILRGNLLFKLIGRVKSTSKNKFNLARAMLFFTILLLSASFVSAGDVIYKAGDFEIEGSLDVNENITLYGSLFVNQSKNARGIYINQTGDAEALKIYTTGGKAGISLIRDNAAPSTKLLFVREADSNANQQVVSIENFGSGPALYISSSNGEALKIASGNANISGNMSLGEKITFTLGEIIDNIVDGWIEITGGLNVTDNVTADYYFGDGSQLTNLPAGGNLSWNETRADDLYVILGTKLGNTTAELEAWIQDNRSKDVTFGADLKTSDFWLRDNTLRTLWADGGAQAIWFTFDNNTLTTRSEANIIFNYDGGAYDFTVRGNDDPYLIYTRGSVNDRVCIGCQYPSVKFEVNGSAKVTENITADYFIGNGSQLTDVLTSYDTGWVSNSDWTNQHLGTSVGGNVTHNLATPLSDLLVKVMISTDGSDDNSFEFTATNQPWYGVGNFGIQIDQVDENKLIIQTGINGFVATSTVGGGYAVNTQDWYYKIKVFKLI